MSPINASDLIIFGDQSDEINSLVNQPVGEFPVPVNLTASDLIIDEDPFEEPLEEGEIREIDKCLRDAKSTDIVLDDDKFEEVIDVLSDVDEVIEKHMLKEHSRLEQVLRCDANPNYNPNPKRVHQLVEDQWYSGNNALRKHPSERPCTGDYYKAEQIPPSPKRIKVRKGMPPIVLPEPLEDGSLNFRLAIDRKTGQPFPTTIRGETLHIGSNGVLYGIKIGSLREIHPWKRNGKNHGSNGTYFINFGSTKNKKGKSVPYQIMVKNII